MPSKSIVCSGHRWPWNGRCVRHHDRRREGFTEQDSKVAGLGPRSGQRRASLPSTNGTPWRKNDRTMDQMRKKLMNDFSFMPYAPFVFLSAKTGQRVDRLFELIVCSRSKRHAYLHRHAQRRAGRRYRPGTAAHRQRPPVENLLHDPGFHQTAHVRLFVPTGRICSIFSYQRYLENQIRAVFGLRHAGTLYRPGKGEGKVTPISADEGW